MLKHNPAISNDLGPDATGVLDVTHSDGSDVTGKGGFLSDPVFSVVQLLQRTFGQDFALIDVGFMQAVYEPPSMPGIDWLRWAAVCREVNSHGQPEIVEDVSPFVLLAIPLPEAYQLNLVAIGLFVTERVDASAGRRKAAKSLVCDETALLKCWSESVPWHPDSLVRVAGLALAHLKQKLESEERQEELLETSSQLLTTYEEISLLHRLTEHLSISSGEADLADLAAGWLADVVPAEAIAIYLSEVRHDSSGPANGAPRVALLTRGDFSLGEDQLVDLVSDLSVADRSRPVVVNRLSSSRPGWPYEGARDAVLVPIRDSERQRGWLLALNHTGDMRLGSRDFGSVEARLLGSVATILGIHSSNIGLFRAQTEFFEEVVRALTSAIDAKDPYTCGHSDRVARVSVCLARQLGLSGEELNTLYLSGLLHDIGKIGIDDTVLRKPSRLTKEEFEHIKTHPELGYKILKGIKRLDKSLPVVLHHHEAWDGSGYPHGLMGEAIPYLARICAVADAFDAMGSDRPYRAGMPDDKVDTILRHGAGQQWDPEVVEAFFAVRDEIRQISRHERNPLSLNVQQWQH